MTADGYRRLFLQQPEGRQLVVARRDDLLGRFPGQDISDVRGAPRLLDARDARKDLLRDGQRVVDRIELLQAPVAGTTVGALVLLAEILDQRPVTAARARGVLLHVPQQCARTLGPFAVGLEHLPPAHEVAARINKHALRRQPVPSRAARLLLIVLR